MRCATFRGRALQQFRASPTRRCADWLCWIERRRPETAPFFRASGYFGVVRDAFDQPGTVKCRVKVKIASAGLTGSEVTGASQAGRKRQPLLSWRTLRPGGCLRSVGSGACGRNDRVTPTLGFTCVRTTGEQYSLAGARRPARLP